MESQVRYLDELVIAVRESKKRTDHTSVGTAIFQEAEVDVKCLQIVHTLLRNINDINNETPDIIFHKSLTALDITLSTQPYLLSVPSELHHGENILLVELINSLLKLAQRCYPNIHRLWFIRNKIGKWCQLGTRLFGTELKSTINKHFQYLATKFESDCKIFLVSSQTLNIQLFLHNLKELYTLLYWFSSPPEVFGDSLFLLQGYMGLNDWDLVFQRLIRIILYIFASIQLTIDADEVERNEFTRLQINFINLVPVFLISRTYQVSNNKHSLVSVEQLKFTLDVLNQFMKSKFTLINEDISFCKSLLRVYVLCLKTDENSKCQLISNFRDILPIEQWMEKIERNHVNDEKYSTLERVLLLIYFDITRRQTTDMLEYDQTEKIWYTTECHPLVNLLSHPLSSKSKQLEKLRALVLQSFKANTRLASFIVMELNKLEPGIIERNGHEYKALIKECSISIKRAIKTNNYSKLTKWVKVLGNLACIESNIIRSSPEKQDIELHCKDLCNICDSQSSRNVFQFINPSRPSAETSSEVYKLLIKYFILNPSSNDFSEPLASAILLCIHKIFAHFQPPPLLDNETKHTPLFTFFERCFRSSSRYLRLQSCKVLPLWNISNLHNSDDTISIETIKFLQKYDNPIIMENTVISWIQITITTNGDVFDTLLLKLIDLFNSENYALHIMMREQIVKMSQTLNKTPYQLLSPILPILLRQIMKNITQKKVTFQRLTNLIGYKGKVVLDIFQRYIVPYATIQYKSDIFGEMAKIMCDADPELLMQQKEHMLTKNSRQIFAVALVKHGFFSLDTIETLFLNRVPFFDRRYIGSYLPDYKTLAEITKLYKNKDMIEPSDTENENMVLCSLRYLTTNFDKDKRHGAGYKNMNNWTKEQENQFQKNLQDNILGIFQVFSSDIHDVEGKTTYYEKLRVINGIMFLIKHVSKKCIISALAQLSICLQSGLEIPEVRYVAMRCWHLLIKTLTEEELSTVIDSLIAFILIKWDEFNKRLQTLTINILTTLVKEKQNLLLKIKPYISLALLSNSEIKVLDIDPIFSRLVAKLRNNTELLPIFINNLKSNNKYVIQQNLNDIEKYLSRKQSDLFSSEEQIQNNGSDLSALIGALLDTAHKYRTTHPNLCETCAKCISMVGVPDLSNKMLETATKNKWKVFDLNDYRQTVHFLIWIIDDILVPSFWQSENPSKQLFFALVMQESLKYCGLSSQSWDINYPENYPDEWDLWNRFNTISKTTLYPLLSSLYLSQSWNEYVPLQYPSFNFRDGYKTWIKSFVLDLLKTGTTEDHPLHVFSSLIREDDGSLSKLLLPYICLDIIIQSKPGSEYEKLMQNIILEVKSVLTCEINGLNHLQKDSLKMCYEIVFSVHEYCKKWITKFKQDYNKNNGTFIIREEKYLKMLGRIEYFLQSVPLNLLAQKSLETNAFERSALYLEEYFRSSNLVNERALPVLKDLQRTYEEIGDIDSIDGLLKSFSSKNFVTKIEELQYSDKWNMALECFDILGSFPQEKEVPKIMLKSMFDHHLYKEVVDKIPKLLSRKDFDVDNNNIQIYKRGIESSILEGDFSEINSWTKKIELLDHVQDPELILQYNLGKAFTYISGGRKDKVNDYIRKCYLMIGTQYASNSNSTTLLKTQSLLTKLHGLYDINILNDCIDSIQYNSVLKILDSRRQRIGANFDPNFYILSLRKAYGKLEQDKSVKKDLTNTYFSIAHEARVNSRLDIAAKSLMYCLENDHPQSELEFAEILWKDGENDRALKLVREIHEKYKQSESVASRDKAEVLLKFTEWLDQSNNSASEQIIAQYQDIFTLDPDWEEPYYSIGLYFSRLLERRKAEGYQSDGKLEYKSVSYFLLAFEKNTVKIRENLPKVITFWLDIAASAITETSPNRNAILKKTTADICKQIEIAIQNCPTYVWYSVLTQLLSRLLHPHNASAKLIMHILLSLSIEYPEQILWHISVLCQSNSTKRVKCGREILEKYKKHTENSRELVNSAANLTSSLTKVCLQEVKNVNSRSGKSLENDFKFDMTIAPTHMAVPVRRNLEMISPRNAASMKSYRPFGTVVSIAKFSSSYKIFSSLKKPKKITIIGSDGNIYEIMCKKEDVRQDNQYMQFASTMDFLLGKDLDSTKRKLGITIYSVLSLREDCGLLEIVPDVITLRSIFTTQYESRKIKYSMKSMYEKWQNTPDELKMAFYNDQLAKFKPILHEWFLENFPEPINWFKARNTYARSYSVMAMVGYILGLGDRHCENILLDIKTGKVLHVDFDCLFEKGKHLPVPEIVPFRLTPNLQDALGILGTEGTFKRTSEVTLSLMRQNEVALMNIIETIIYDRNMDHSIQKALRTLRNKIRGIDPRDGLLLSVSGQAETLIQEATSKDNLSRMYIGWLPFW